MIYCSKCGGRTIVYDVRDEPGGTIRRRRCRQCSHKFTTHERTQAEPVPYAKCPECGGALRMNTLTYCKDCGWDQESDA